MGYDVKKAVISVLVLIAVLSLDQFSKWYASEVYLSQGSFVVCEYCNVVQLWNTGISFGMFSDMENGNVTFMCITMVIILMLIVMLIRAQGTSKVVWLSVLDSGAIGNFLDRVRFGAVYDFIDLHIGELHWPAFNLADACIVLGVVAFLWIEAKACLEKREEKRGV
ncbi:signal peptidase II [Candidatus Anaplasma sp. TIGMIC]|uniref:signal peptidase II n=1 Tax=Candidatus Anaplasma sp. TIGMIC TaxID=3020713 RepID=UPI00232B094E|nr:signal peptidase II [Candidatus Anaplasma sp. TIGMIC]MDB1135325.1 signal peptidase II [Candidatus Anaplasma sp. TIGMIC]